MMTIEEIRAFRLLRPEKFDRQLELAVMRTEPGMGDAIWCGNDIFVPHPATGRLEALTGPDALPFAMGAAVKLDLAYECLTGEPVRVGLEGIKRCFGLGWRRAESAYEKRRGVVQHVLSENASSWQAVALVWLRRAASALDRQLRENASPTTVRRGAA